MKNDHTHGSYGSYITGFACSILLTLIAFDTVSNHPDAKTAVITIILLAVVQLIIQLRFFLHLSFRQNERWNITAFFFTSFMLLFIVIGSLWIMNHLNRNMSPEQISSYMHKQN